MGEGWSGDGEMEVKLLLVANLKVANHKQLAGTDGIVGFCFGYVPSAPGHQRSLSEHNIN